MGQKKIDDVKSGLLKFYTVLRGLLIVKEVNKDTKPLKDSQICGCTNLNPHMAVLIKTLVDLGASVSWCSSNVNTVEDDVCSALALSGVKIFSWKGMNEEDYWWCVDECIRVSTKPDLIIDDGGDLTQRMYSTSEKKFHNLIGIVEISSYGVYKLYAMANSQQLLVPAINLTNSISLVCFELAHMLQIAGKKFLVCGYGHRGKGCAKTLRQLGAIVYVTEIDPICALQACTDGIEVVEMISVLQLVDGIILCTENTNIIGKNEIPEIKDGCLIINYGHAQNEVDLEGIKALAQNVNSSNHNITKLYFESNKIINLLFNAEPVQSVSFQLPDTILSIQTSAIVTALVELKLFSREKYSAGVFLLPRILDEYISSIHLTIFSANITKLSEEQAQFLNVPKEGPFKSQHYRY